jgi:hypothetical protein
MVGFSGVAYFLGGIGANFHSTYQVGVRLVTSPGPVMVVVTVAATMVMAMLVAVVIAM